MPLKLRDIVKIVDTVENIIIWLFNLGLLLDLSGRKCDFCKIGNFGLRKDQTFSKRQQLLQQHAHTHFRLGVHVPPGTGIWGYRLKFDSTPLKVSNRCSYFDGISHYPQKFVIPIILEILTRGIFSCLNSTCIR